LHKGDDNEEFSGDESSFSVDVAESSRLIKFPLSSRRDTPEIHIKKHSSIP
jgi:hypothetical protein